MDCSEIIDRLKALSRPENIAGMARFGINPENTYGVSIPNLRGLARETGKNHALAQELWDSGIHEARILAGMIDDPKLVELKQMEAWVKDFDSWDVCDQVCLNLFAKTSFACDRAAAWSRRDEEFVRRAGFVVMACLAVGNKKADNSIFAGFLPLIKTAATDERNYVKKAVNWALRQIGKRNLTLNRMALEKAGEIQEIRSKSARWIAADAIRELTGEAVRKRLADKQQKG
ncbi:MAG: DNA alkylation repair protein [Chloroflexota bacterium]